MHYKKKKSVPKHAVVVDETTYLTVEETCLLRNIASSRMYCDRFYLDLLRHTTRSLCYTNMAALSTALVALGLLSLFHAYVHDLFPDQN